MAERYVRPPLTATEPDPLARPGRRGSVPRRLALALLAALVVVAVVAAGLAVGHRLHGDDTPGVGGLPAPIAAPTATAAAPTAAPAR